MEAENITAELCCLLIILKKEARKVYLLFGEI